MDGNFQKPEYHQNENTNESASRIVRGSNGFQNEVKKVNEKQKRKGLTIDEAVDGLLNNDKNVLARTITLIESNASKHLIKGQMLLNEILPYTGKSIRVGVTGVPGAGKSTFIESMGYYLCEKGYRVAVLAVDPSSSITGGSILGDKTRMERLSRHKNAYVRPSPSGGTLGGVARKTRETILLCEAAGYDVIFVETIGVGQSEIMVRSMVDFFALLVLTGAGDDLQGMKKGVMELADLLIVNKADGDNTVAAQIVKEEYNQVLHYLRPATKGWETKAVTCSSIKENGIKEIWSCIQQFKHNTIESGLFFERRQEQVKDWIYEMIKTEIENRFFNHPEIKQLMPEIEDKVIEGKETVTLAVQRLMETYEKVLEK